MLKVEMSISIAVNLHRVIHFKIVGIASYHCNNKSRLYVAFEKKRGKAQNRTAT